MSSDGMEPMTIAEMTRSNTAAQSQFVAAMRAVQAHTSHALSGQAMYGHPMVPSPVLAPSMHNNGAPAAQPLPSYAVPVAGTAAWAAQLGPPPPAPGWYAHQQPPQQPHVEPSWDGARGSVGGVASNGVVVSAVPGPYAAAQPPTQGKADAPQALPQTPAPAPRFLAHSPARALGPLEAFVRAFWSNFRTFAIMGVNWGLALFIANQIYMVIPIFMSPSGRRPRVELYKGILNVVVLISIAAFVITTLNIFVHEGFTVVALAPSADPNVGQPMLGGLMRM